MFYYCRHCKQLVYVVKKTGANLVCCGENMQELVANTTDAANEKHVPVVNVNGNVVKVVVGEVEHPMLDVHYIEWIVLETNLGYHQAKLNPGQKPEATFVLVEGEQVVKAYEYCNLHSLWATK